MGKKKRQNRPGPETLGLPCVGVETHAHLDFDPLQEQLPAILDRATAAGVAQIVQVFLGPDPYHAHAARFDAHSQISFTVGLHPHDAEACNADALSAMESICRNDPRLKAVGEIGLDFYWNHCPPDEQRKAFAEQLELAKSLDLPVVIHSRDAHTETVTVLREMGFVDRPVLWHCFGGGLEEAKEIVNAGWHCSIPGPVTYSRNVALREAVTAIPLARLVLETDCPYLTPEPWRGTTNEPALMAFTGAAVANCKAMDPAELWAASGQTARAFFNLPQPEL